MQQIALNLHKYCINWQKCVLLHVLLRTSVFQLWVSCQHWLLPATNNIIYPFQWYLSVNLIKTMC